MTLENHTWEWRKSCRLGTGYSREGKGRNERGKGIELVSRHPDESRVVCEGTETAFTRSLGYQKAYEEKASP